MKKIDQFLRENVIKDVTITGYMMFLNDKGLLKEGMEYVKGFIQTLKNDELEGLFLKAREALKSDND